MIALGLIVEAALFLLLGFVKTDEYNGVDPDYITGEHKYIEMMNIIDEVEQCKKELSKLTKNIETMNSVYDGVIDSIKTPDIFLGEDIPSAIVLCPMTKYDRVKIEITKKYPLAIANHIEDCEVYLLWLIPWALKEISLLI